MGVSLMLLTDRAAGNEIFDEGGETWPPKVLFKDGFGMENTHVAREGGGVDRMKQSRLGRGGNEHAVVEIEMAIIVGPVRERGLGEQGRSSGECGESFKYKQVGGQGGLDMTGEDKVEGIYNNWLRKNGGVCVIRSGVEMVFVR